MFERPDGGERAILVHITASEGMDGELLDLARSAGAQVQAEIATRRPVPDPKHYIGSGKVEELRHTVTTHNAGLVIFGVSLSPSQERNLGRVLQCRVLDRTGLILDIFAQRAVSYEGKLQVELAQLEHLSTRLVRGWTHLERQKGGIGLHGPGETQLETDRRLLRQRIKQIRARLDQVRGRRSLSRRARQRAALPVTSLVGYTNAGKSTLFNQLTGAAVIAKDQLFATLDPTFRRLLLPSGASTVVADTVGFVSHLPHDLVAAFEATLEESRLAQLLLHVVDASDPERDVKTSQVLEVLEHIDAATVPRLEVYNKIDRLGFEPRIDVDEAGLPSRVWVSAAKGIGLTLLSQAIAQRLHGDAVVMQVTVPWHHAAVRAALYQSADVLSEALAEEQGWCLQVRATLPQVKRLISKSAQEVKVRDGESIDGVRVAVTGAS